MALVPRGYRGVTTGLAGHEPRGWRLPRFGVQQSAITGQDQAVDAISFGANTETAAKVFDLRRIDDGDCDSSIR